MLTMTFDLSLPARGSTLRLEFAPDTGWPGSGAGVAAGTARIVPVANGDGGVELPVTALTVEGLLDALVAIGAKGIAGETTRVVVDDTLFVCIGLGDADAIDDDAVRRAYGSAARSLEGVERAVASTEFGTIPVVEGLLLGGYTYSGFKSQGAEAKTSDDTSASADTNDSTSVNATVTVVAPEAEREAFERAVIVAESVNLARDLVNTPANYLYPESYAAVMHEVAEQAGLTCEIYDEQQLAQHAYGGILAVGGGSQRPPRLVHLTWAPEEAGATRESIALVGKGITFDTGGISIKPASKMEDMISDMGGSAAQLGAIVAAARLGERVRIDAWLPLAENMPSGSATRPGDVITHYGGITSEVLNTDAEGRLVLADAIARACEGDSASGAPAYLIETATLTGAQLVALGTRTAGVMGSDELRDAVAETGREVGEPAWAMPLLDEQVDELKSPVADVRNVHNARTGGMCFAGLYLSQFVPEQTQWVHIDIAGPAWNGGSAYGFTPARATGAPVRTITEVIRRIAAGELQPAADNGE